MGWVVRGGGEVARNDIFKTGVTVSLVASKFIHSWWRVNKVLAFWRKKNWLG